MVCVSCMKGIDTCCNVQGMHRISYNLKHIPYGKKYLRDKIFVSFTYLSQISKTLPSNIWLLLNHENGHEIFARGQSVNILALKSYCHNYGSTVLHVHLLLTANPCTTL